MMYYTRFQTSLLSFSKLIKCMYLILIKGTIRQTNLKVFATELRKEANDN